jgi:hypothetical protein
MGDIPLDEPYPGVDFKMILNAWLKARDLIFGGPGPLFVMKSGQPPKQ